MKTGISQQHIDIEIKNAAQKIGAHDAHAYDKHRHKFDNRSLGDVDSVIRVKSDYDFQKVIQNTLHDPKTIGFRTPDGPSFFYNKEYNVAVVIDPFTSDGGTAFRPDEGEKWITEKLEDIADANPELKLTPGGYAAVHYPESSYGKKAAYLGSVIGDDVSTFGKSIKELERLGKNGGTVAGFIIGGGVAAYALTQGASPAEAAKLAGETAFPYGEAGNKLRKGDIEGARDAAIVETGGNVGCVAGTAALVPVGAAVGSAVPGPGTGAGAVVFGIGGCVGGAVAASGATDYALKHAGEIKDVAVQLAGDAKKAFMDLFSRPLKPLTAAQIDMMIRELPPKDMQWVSPDSKSIREFLDPLAGVMAQLDKTPLTDPGRAKLEEQHAAFKGLLDGQRGEILGYEGEGHVAADIGAYSQIRMAQEYELERQRALEQAQEPRPDSPVFIRDRRDPNMGFGAPN